MRMMTIHVTNNDPVYNLARMPHEDDVRMYEIGLISMPVEVELHSQTLTRRPCSRSANQLACDPSSLVLSVMQDKPLWHDRYVQMMVVYLRCKQLAAGKMVLTNA